MGYTSLETDRFVLGNGVYLGANATIIGRVQLADHIVIGANACGVRSCLRSHASLVGVPAKEIPAAVVEDEFAGLLTLLKSQI